MHGWAGTYGVVGDEPQTAAWNCPRTSSLVRLDSDERRPEIRVGQWVLLVHGQGLAWGQVRNAECVARLRQISALDAGGSNV